MLRQGAIFGIEGVVRKLRAGHTLLAYNLSQSLLQEHKCTPHSFIDCTHVEKMATTPQ